MTGLLAQFRQSMPTHTQTSSLRIIVYVLTVTSQLVSDFGVLGIGALSHISFFNYLNELVRLHLVRLRRLLTCHECLHELCERQAYQTTD